MEKNATREGFKSHRANKSTSNNLKNMENVTLLENQAQNVTPKAPTVAEKERVKKKELFLEFYEKTLCMLKASAEKVGVARKTIYEWVKEDPEFRQKKDEITSRIAEDIEERYKRFLLKDDSTGLTALMFWLRLRHPDYKQMVKVEHIAPTKTLKQLIEEYENDKSE